MMKKAGKNKQRPLPNVGDVLSDCSGRVCKVLAVGMMFDAPPEWDSDTAIVLETPLGVRIYSIEQFFAQEKVTEIRPRFTPAKERQPRGKKLVVVENPDGHPCHGNCCDKPDIEYDPNNYVHECCNCGVSCDCDA